MAATKIRRSAVTGGVRVNHGLRRLRATARHRANLGDQVARNIGDIHVRGVGLRNKVHGTEFERPKSNLGTFVRERTTHDDRDAMVGDYLTNGFEVRPFPASRRPS